MEPDIPEFGFKFHMNDVNATIGLANLRHMPRILDACRTNAAYYDSHLKGCRGVVLMPPPKPGSAPAYWLYARAGRDGGRPRQRQHHTATPATAMGQGASPPPGQRPQPLRSHPPAPRCRQERSAAPSPAYRYTLRLTDGRRSAFMEHMASKGVTVSAVHQRNDVHSCVARFSCLLPKVSYPDPHPYP